MKKNLDPEINKIAGIVKQGVNSVTNIDEVDICPKEIEENNHANGGNIKLFDLITLDIFWDKYLEDLKKLGLKRINISQLEGIDKNYMLVTTPHPSKKKETNRDMFLYKNANKIQVIDCSPLKAFIYSDGIGFLFDVDTNIFIMGYVSKARFNMSCCTKIKNTVIPYTFKILRRKDTQVEVDPLNKKELEDKLKEPFNEDLLQIKYKASSKNISNLNDKFDVCKYLREAQKSMTTMVHSSQMEKIIYEILME